MMKVTDVNYGNNRTHANPGLWWFIMRLLSWYKQTKRFKLCLFWQ